MSLRNAYLRRKAWEHRAQAVAIVNALGEAMGGSGSDASSGYKEVSTGEMFREIGLE